MSGTATFDRWIGEILSALASAQPKRLHLLPASFGLPEVQEGFETLKLWDEWSNTVQWLEREGYIRYERYSSGTENEPVFYDTELSQMGRNRMFETFPQSEIDIVAPDGTLRSKTKAILDSKQATIPDAMVQIHAGDEIRRKIPNGTEETFEVIDPVYHGNFHGIPEHFQVKIRRKGTFPAGSGGHYSFHVSGPNARVNFHSVDNSTNRVGSDTVFSDLRSAYEQAALDHEDEARIIALIDEMESAKDGGKFKDAYVKFMQQAAEHMTVAAPFIPALVEYLKS